MIGACLNVHLSYIGARREPSSQEARINRVGRKEGSGGSAPLAVNMSPVTFKLEHGSF